MVLSSCNTAISTIPEFTLNGDTTKSPVTDETTNTVIPSDTNPSDTALVTPENTTSSPVTDNTVVPTATPTPTPTPSVTPEPTEPDKPVIPPVEGGIPESPAVDASYFDDAAFIGDSVTMRLQIHALANKTALGKANFFTIGNFSAYDALKPVASDSIHPSYQGKKMTAEDCIAACGAKKVYIMLGMNDISNYRGGTDVAIDRYTTLIKRILAKNPGVKIFVQSMTPTLAVSSVHVKGITNERIKEYNQKIVKMCSENGWYFVNVASVMYDETGAVLKTEYCSDPADMALHLNDAAAKVWVQYLKTHTAG